MTSVTEILQKLMNNKLLYIAISICFIVLLPWLVFGLNPITNGFQQGTRGVWSQYTGLSLIWFFIDTYRKKHITWLWVIAIPVIFGIGIYLTYFY